MNKLLVGDKHDAFICKHNWKIIIINVAIVVVEGLSVDLEMPYWAYFSSYSELCSLYNVYYISGDCKSGPDPLLEEYRKRLSSEYITLCLNADEVTKQLKAKAQKPDDICHKDIWYKLLTDETIYRHCKLVNGFALKFLNRSLNEAVVEVKVASLNETSTERRPLSTESTKNVELHLNKWPPPPS